jgi:hypothetical protein
VEDSAFSGEFCRFLQTSVPSVAAAELLLVLARDRDNWRELPELVARMPPGSNLSDTDALKYFESQGRTLAAIGADRRIRYSPASADLDLHVQTLARAYNERPVTLIRVIYALRDSRIKSFADAFKLRRD